MMKLKTLALAALTGAGLLLGANDKQIFDTAIKHVDLGGTYLYYQNLTSITAKSKKLPELIYNVMLKSGQSRKEAALTADTATVAIKVLNPEVLKASAVSSVTVTPDCYVMKQFVYCDTKTPSFLDFMAKTNRATAWQQLPADTRFALRGEVHLGTLFARVMAELRSSKNLQLRALPLQLEALKAQGINLEALLNSIEGEVELLICGSDVNDIKIKVVIPDKNGAIAPILKGFLPPAQGSNKAMLPMAMPNGKMPVLIYGQNALTLVTDEALLNPVIGKATLVSLPQFAAYSKVIPAQICSYTIINFDQKTIDVLKALAAKNPEAGPALSMLHPFSLIAVGSRQDEGLASTIASSFSIPDAMVILPYRVSMLTMLPALQQARSKAQQVQCANNIKQLCLGVAIYAIDHNESFPAALDALKKENFVTDAKIFACPRGKKPFIYLGAGVELKKLKNAYQYPVIFDAPGCGHKEVNVGMADGHVMSIKVPNYKSPAQVIGVLNKKFHYSPEMLNELLAKVAKVK